MQSEHMLLWKHACKSHPAHDAHDGSIQYAEQQQGKLTADNSLMPIKTQSLVLRRGKALSCLSESSFHRTQGRVRHLKCWGQICLGLAEAALHLTGLLAVSLVLLPQLTQLLPQASSLLHT